MAWLSHREDVAYALHRSGNALSIAPVMDGGACGDAGPKDSVPENLIFCTRYMHSSSRMTSASMIFAPHQSRPWRCKGPAACGWVGSGKPGRYGDAWHGGCYHIQCSDSPAFHRLQTSAFCAGDSLDCFPSLINTILNRRTSTRWCCGDLSNAPDFPAK
jgi:hypothetical protein